MEKNTESLAVELSEESENKAKRMIERLKNPPYSRKKSAQYLKERVGVNGHLKSEDIQINNKQQLIEMLMAGIYAKPAGYRLDVLNDYRQEPKLKVRNIEFIREVKSNE